MQTEKHGGSIPNFTAGLEHNLPQFTIVVSKRMKSPKLLANAQSESRKGIRQMNTALQERQ